MTRGLLALALTTVILVALQLAAISPLRVGGVVVMVIWLWPLSLSLTGDTRVAAVTGFLAGVLFDAHSLAPFALSGVVGVVVALAAGPLGREGVGDLDGAAWWVTPALGAATGFMSPLVYVVAGALTGHPDLWRGNLGVMMVVNAVACAVLARPFTRLAQYLANSGGWSRA